ncbi:TOMM precursor leader peptide-binding protein [Dactylosporangium vinaceum]
MDNPAGRRPGRGSVVAMRRPTLLPGLRRLWRDRRTIQLGTDPATAVVLELRRPELARVLDLLDGSRTLPGLLAEARLLGLDGADVADLVEQLRVSGLVVAAASLLPAGLAPQVGAGLTTEAAAITLRLRAARPAVRRTAAGILLRRTGAHVLVAGDGPLLAPLAAALAGAGVGHVEPLVEGMATHADVAVGGIGPGDVRDSRVLATTAAVARHAPWVRQAAGRADAVDFVVRVGERRLDALARRGVRLERVPRLEVLVRLGTVLVGPLVRPSRSPCRGCLDLHRQDRDPLWPALAAQLATAPPGLSEPCSLTTAMAGAAFAADEVLTYLDGGPLRTEAAIVEIPRPGEFRRRVWGTHPRCDCRRRRRSGSSG